MTDQTLIEFINDKLSPSEKRRIIKWIEASEENRKRYHLIKARQTAAAFNTPAFDVEKGYRDLQGRTLQKKKMLPLIIRIAASVLLIVTAWIVWNPAPEESIPQQDSVPVTAEQVMVAERGENHEVTLPDGSTVLLNSDSRITWNSDFDAGEREIHLTGEAFFDVVRDTLRPFIVHTGNMDVKVLGTTFNVRAYPDDKEPVTTLISGAVEVSGDDQSTVTLRPMQTAVLDRNTDRFEIFDITENEAAPWREGKLMFKDTPLETVIRDIERKYDVKCKVVSLDMKDFLFTGTFNNLTIEEVLRVLKISSDIDHRKNGDTIEFY